MMQCMADPDFNKSGSIGMLLDNSVFWDCSMETYQIHNGPTLKHTPFGWLIGGEVSIGHKRATTLFSRFNKEESNEELVLDKKLEQFFSAENIDSTRPVLTAEEKYCESHYIETTTRDDGGKFIVKMPIKQNALMLGNNLNTAIH